MSKRTIIGFTILFVLSLGMGTGAPPQDIADMALVNGKVVTLDPKNPAAEAVAVKGGRILAAGSSAEIRKYVGPATQVLDVKGKLVIPGLIDAHLHFASGGRSLASLTFRGVSSVEKVQEMVAARIRELPAGETVNGSEYDHTLFPGQKWPSKEDLDKVAPNNAVVIRRVDGHSVWVNSEAAAAVRHHQGHQVPLRRGDRKRPRDRGADGHFQGGRLGPPQSEAFEQAVLDQGRHRARTGLRGHARADGDPDIGQPPGIGDFQAAQGRRQADPSRLRLAAHR